MCIFDTSMRGQGLQTFQMLQTADDHPLEFISVWRINSLHMKKFHFIYKTICIPTELIYIGAHSTNKINDGYLGSGPFFKSIIRQYKCFNFKREILEFCDYNEMSIKEKFWQKVCDSTNPSIGYNIRVSGAGIAPRESKFGSDNPFFNHQHTEETKTYLSIIRIGRKASEETKQKMSETKLGEKNHFYGKQHSLEARREMSITQKNRPYTICNVCGLKSRSASNTKRYHFNNCKNKHI